MPDTLTRMPFEIAAFVTVLLIALGVLGWSMHSLINGPRAEGSAPVQDQWLRWIYANG